MKSSKNYINPNKYPNKSVTFYFADQEIFHILEELKNRDKSRFVAQAIKDRYERLNKKKTLETIKIEKKKYPQTKKTGTQILNKFRTK
jgi:hypothetical protein